MLGSLDDNGNYCRVCRWIGQIQLKGRRSDRIAIPGADHDIQFEANAIPGQPLQYFFCAVLYSNVGGRA